MVDINTKSPSQSFPSGTSFSEKDRDFLQGLENQLLYMTTQDGSHAALLDKDNDKKVDREEIVASLTGSGLSLKLGLSHYLFDKGKLYKDDFTSDGRLSEVEDQSVYETVSAALKDTKIVYGENENSFPVDHSKSLSDTDLQALKSVSSFLFNNSLAGEGTTELTKGEFVNALKKNGSTLEQKKAERIFDEIASTKDSLFDREKITGVDIDFYINKIEFDSY